MPPPRRHRTRRGLYGGDPCDRKRGRLGDSVATCTIVVHGADLAHGYRRTVGKLGQRILDGRCADEVESRLVNGKSYVDTWDCDIRLRSFVHGREWRHRGDWRVRQRVARRRWRRNGVDDERLLLREARLFTAITNVLCYERERMPETLPYGAHPCVLVVNPALRYRGHA